MGGVMGAVVGKFVVAGSALCLPMSINHHRINAAFDPAASTSSVSRAHAPSLGGTHIGIGAERFDVAAGDLAVVDRIDGSCGPVDLLVGRDVIAAHLWEADLAKRRLRLILPYERRSIETRFRSGPASELDFSRQPGGRMLIDLANGTIGLQP